MPLLLPAVAVDRHAARPDSPFQQMYSARDSLIKQGVQFADLLHVHSSGDTFSSVYEVGHKIGEGAFGKVFTATHKILGISRAVKRLIKSHDGREPHQNELKALLALDHPHIVKLLEYYDEDDFLFLVFELCEGVDLHEHITSTASGRMREYDASVALRHMLKALQCCHAHYRGHYDIKPENFMFKHKSFGNLKMVDLGLSSAFDTQRRKKVSGTAVYMAPEFWSGIYGPEGDVWSCGVVLFVMLTGHPFLQDVPPVTMRSELKVRKLIREQIEFAATEFGLSQAAHNLLSQLLQHDRHARPSIKEALKHPFNSGSYRLERRIPSKSSHEALLNHANEILVNLLSTVRLIMPEPMLKRISRLIMVQNSEVSETHCLAFRMLDLHGYGELSISALEQDERVSPEGQPADDIDQIFEALDLNRDGYISYRSFLAAILPDDVLRNERALQVAFSILDTDKDGFIGQDDLAKVFDHNTGSGVCKATIEEVSPDGCVSWEQFWNLMQAPAIENAQQAVNSS